MPVLEEPSDPGQRGDNYDKTYVKAKRKDEEFGSSAPDKRQHVMTESQLAML